MFGFLPDDLGTLLLASTLVSPGVLVVGWMAWEVAAAARARLNDPRRLLSRGGLGAYGAAVHSNFGFGG